MGLTIHREKIDSATAERLIAICPFGALEDTNGVLTVNAACRSCKLCVKKGPAGAITWADEAKLGVDKSVWRGVAVFAERRGDGLHPVTLELLGKARDLAAVTEHPVYALLIGTGVMALAEELMHYGADKVFVYDDPAFAAFTVSPYANAFYDFIKSVHPSSILVGATNLGRSLAPKVAARCDTGLTADCTMLEMKGNTDLVQIRPAFGGNIMAQIVTPSVRPQFCTVRYKIFSAPQRQAKARGEIVRMDVTKQMLTSRTEALSLTEKLKEIDVSEADAIVACGRGFKSRADLDMAQELATLLNAQLACTRPLIEAGWMDPRRQIGLSGRTVKPKLIFTLGVSGSVQFAAGMKGAELIVSVNSDPTAAIFDIAHIGLTGDLYEIVPKLIAKIREGAQHV